MFERLKTRYTTWKLQNAQVAELKSLSNRDLADIGIKRHDIERVVRSFK